MRKIASSFSHESLSEKLKDKKWSAYSLKEVCKSDALKVKSFRQLVEYTAHISYHNRGMSLFYRGQDGDYPNQTGQSTFYPSIYRGNPSYNKGRITQRQMDTRMAILSRASDLLIAQLASERKEKRLSGLNMLRKYKELCWAILQHYEICRTPVLDLTHSLRVAASFALLQKDGTLRKEGYLFLFGLPGITDSINYYVNDELVNMRLLSHCPPDAQRPHFQEGYVAGHFPHYGQHKKNVEFDFNQRLVAKFRLDNSRDFWGKEFSHLPKDALFPDAHDPFFSMRADIVSSISSEFGKDYWSI